MESVCSSCHQPKRMKLDPADTPRNFDKEHNEFSDLVVVVGDQKFYVSKWILSHHSDYFKTMMGNPNFEEANRQEITLENWTPQDFQLFMETILGDPCVNDTSVEKILEISDYLLATTATRRCEEYLVYFSSKTSQKKYELADKYKLNDLKATVISEVKTGDELRAICPGDLSTLDQETMAMFLNKSISMLPKNRFAF